MLNKTIKTIGLIFTSLVSLSACTDVAEYKTPELFFGFVGRVTSRMTCTSSKYETKLKDEDGSLLKELKKITEYTTANHIDESSNYFSYEYWQASNAGPNIERMTVYENGYLELYHKRTIFKGQSFYYSIDLDLALSLNRFVEDKINYVIEVEKEATQEAKAYASMENFFKDAKEQIKIYSSCLVGDYSYDFYADINVVNKMCEFEYKQITDETFFELKEVSFEYNSSIWMNESFNWSFNLDKNSGDINLVYYFKDKLENSHSIILHYTMNKDSAKELYDYVSSLIEIPNK